MMDLSGNPMDIANELSGGKMRENNPEYFDELRGHLEMPVTVNADGSITVPPMTLPSAFPVDPEWPELLDY